LAGLVDSSYRGEIKVVLINHGSEPFIVQMYDRVAQILFEKVEVVQVREVVVINENETVRGGGGFGSSGN